MKWLLARRLLSGVAMLFVLSLMTFVFADLAPGDPFTLLRMDSRFSPELVAELEARYGWDRPLLERYGRWLGSVFRGEFGYSIVYQRSVGDLLGARLRNTLLLVSAAFVLSWTSAVLLALWSAAHAGGWIDRSGRLLIAALLGFPRLLIALAGVWLASWLDVLPLGGMRSLGADDLTGLGRWLDLLRHLALPSGILALSFWPMLYLHARDAISESLDAPYVRAALAQGLPHQRWLWLYVLPAASNPLISLLGLSFTALASGSLLIEVVLSWPGMGPLLLEAILARDLHVVLASVLVSGALLVIGHLISDALLLLIDPRLSLEGTR